MIKQIALKITDFIVKNTKFDSELYEVYEYGVESTIFTLLNILLIIAAGIAVSDMISGVVFLAVFIPLRSFVGGYRAKTYFMCNALFLLIYLAVYYINSVAAFIDGELFSMLLTVLILLGIIPIIAFAPVQNKPLSEKYLRICRIIGVTAYILISITALALHYGGIKYGSFIIITLSSVSVLIIADILKRERKIK